MDDVRARLDALRMEEEALEPEPEIEPEPAPEHGPEPRARFDEDEAMAETRRSRRPAAEPPSTPDPPEAAPPRKKPPTEPHLLVGPERDAELAKMREVPNWFLEHPSSQGALREEQLAELWWHYRSEQTQADVASAGELAVLAAHFFQAVERWAAPLQRMELARSDRRALRSFVRRVARASGRAAELGGELHALLSKDRDGEVGMQEFVASFNEAMELLAEEHAPMPACLLDPEDEIRARARAERAEREEKRAAKERRRRRRRKRHDDDDDDEKIRPRDEQEADEPEAPSVAENEDLFMASLSPAARPRPAAASFPNVNNALGALQVPEKERDKARPYVLPEEMAAWMAEAEDKQRDASQKRKKKKKKGKKQ